ncbi:MAG: hypothetical protein H0T77_11715 [Pyrinomonadaceae bacterium]|nr:hypothetical protein [Pyrinomonadaceae bacterium]
MAEERTLGLARAPEVAEESVSKEELQLRMEEARDSITQTVTEIKETVVQQYETVKDALDWREQFKKRPIAWSLGAAGVGFCVGYGIASAMKGEESAERYVSSESHAYGSQPTTGRAYAPLSASRPLSANLDVNDEANGNDEGPGLLERFKETRAFDRLHQEVGSLGDRLVEELSTTAQTVILPALIRKIRDFIGADLSEKSTSQVAPAASMRPRAGAYEPVLERNPG